MTRQYVPTKQRVPPEGLRPLDTATECSAIAISKNSDSSKTKPQLAIAFSTRGYALSEAMPKALRHHCR
ncbi:MAG: hypothetical protein F6K58_07460 [Symploca sp. SIO2E9]|nr:hypothetical protein [Symploca sp. SIO2E9]